MISLEGMYDLHVHPGPSFHRRKFSALEAIKLASKENLDLESSLKEGKNHGIRKVQYSACRSFPMTMRQ